MQNPITLRLDHFYAWSAYFIWNIFWGWNYWKVPTKERIKN